MGQQKKVPFRKWVPGWLQFLCAFIILIPVMMINGAYTGSSVDISSYLGVVSEDISMAFYASSAGMAVGYPLVVRLRPIITTKTILLCGLMIQVILSWICAFTPHIEIIVLCSFFIGFMKAFSLMEIIFIMMPFLSPNGKRNEYYSVYYPITLTLAQFSLLATAYFAYYYHWQYMYNFMIILLLIAIIVVLICFRYGRKPIRIPIRDIDWLSVSFISAFFLLSIYALTYGKIKDWFASEKIIITVALIPIFLYLFIYRQLKSDKPYIQLDVLKNRNSLVGYCFMLVMTFFSTTTTLISSYVNTILKLDSIHSNQLYLLMIPAFFLGGTFCYWWYRKGMSVKTLIFIGFTCFLVSFILLYFQIHPTGLYRALFLPLFLRGLGLLILFVAFGSYVIEGLPQQKYISNAFFLIGIRSVIAPVICSSIFSNWIYRSTLKDAITLSREIDMLNPLAASRYTSALNAALSQGMSLQNAQMTATSSLYNIVQNQSLTLTLKSILGYVIIINIILLIIVLIFPFYLKNKSVKQAKSGAGMV